MATAEPNANSPAAAPGPSASIYVIAALDLAAMLAVLVTAPVAPLRFLDGTLFEYYVNTTSPRLLIYFNGWIHLLPEIVAYAVRGLPISLQFAIYPAVALMLCLIMLREVRKLLAPWFDPLQAAILALVILAYFQFYIPILTYLVWSVWPLAIAALCHILRRNLAGERYGLLGLAATAVACLSNPLAVLFIPVLGCFALTAKDHILRWQNLGLAALLTVWFAAEAALKPASAHYLGGAPVTDGLRLVWHQMKSPDEAAIVIVVALAVTAGTTYAVSCVSDRAVRMAVYALAYVGAASVGLYLFSSRATMLSGVPRRYAIVCCVTALIAIMVYAGHMLDPRQRRMMIMALGTVVAAIELALLSHPYVARIGEQFHYVRAADDFRRSCRPGDALTQPLRASLVVLCTPLDVGPAGGAAVEDRDKYGNAFVTGPQASIWGTTDTKGTRLLAPGR